MRIEITSTGIYGSTGEMPVGTVIDVKEAPKGLEGKYRVIDDAAGKTAVTNPKDDQASKNAPAVPSDLAVLRNEYKAAYGKGPSPKWDADTLRAKIAEKAGQQSFDDMTDTELKTFLGEKGVSVTDETRDQLIELAKVA